MSFLTASAQLLPGTEVVGFGTLQLQPIVEAVLEAAHALRHLLVHEMEGGEAGPVLEAQVRVVTDKEGHPLGVSVCGQGKHQRATFVLVKLIGLILIQVILLLSDRGTTNTKYRYVWYGTEEKRIFIVQVNKIRILESDIFW
jgi:hypothetical protein